MIKDSAYNQLIDDLKSSVKEFKVVGVPSSYELDFLGQISLELNSAILYAYHDISNISSSVFVFYKGKQLSIHNLEETLTRFGFQKSELVEKSGEYSLHGGNIVIVQSPFEIRIEMFGDIIDVIKVRNLDIDESNFHSLNAAGVTSIAEGIKIYYPSKSDDLLGALMFSNLPDDKSYNLVFEDKNSPFIVDLNSFREKYGISSAIDRENDPFFQREIKEGDYIVHEDYGIGIFKGIRLDRGAGNTFEEYFEIEYANKDKLLIPYKDVDKLTKYIGSSNEPVLTKLATKEWKKVKRKVLASILERFKELLDLYTERSIVKGYKYEGEEDVEEKFRNTFEYIETVDQTKAWEEVKKDMSSPRPMDRVVVGDVGFGKTEIAIRASFRAFINNKQVAILCPTTILVSQHYELFKKRMSPFGVKVASLSRLGTSRENSKIIKDLKEGNIDVVIGTHSLLAKNIFFKDLGLLVVDEEQKFGVIQKEKIKKMKTSIDVLSLSATPIPRTLYMGLSGIRDISILSIPPKDRLPIETCLMERNWDEICKIIEEEITKRKGQIYFVHNRVMHMESLKVRLEEMLPDVKFALANGQMDSKMLENVISQFKKKEIDVLLSSSIIENGIDIPQVNLIMVDNAQKFGLSQLYQIRGRVGRSSTQAFCYLIVKDKNELTDIQKDRLDALLNASKLGSGFEISTRDMQIRGAGNILGDAQHGNIEAVGFELYYKFLREMIINKKEKVGMSIQQRYGEYSLNT